jgi:hypothetical protein
MDLKGSLARPLEPATGPYPEPDGPSERPVSLTFFLISSLPPAPESPERVLCVAVACLMTPSLALNGRMTDEL